MDVPFSATYDDASTADFKANVSHKKRLQESYLTGDAANAPSAATNTIVKADEDDFTKGFKDYARYLAERHKKKFPTAVDPSDAGMEYVSRAGISFHSDRAALSTNIHSFPTTKGTDSESLTRAEHQAFKRALLTANATSPKPSQIGRALQAWDAIKALASVQTLLTKVQRAYVRRRLNALKSCSQSSRRRPSIRNGCSTIPTTRRRRRAKATASRSGLGCSLAPAGQMERNVAEPKTAVEHVMRAQLLEHARELRRAGEAAERARQVAVGLAIATQPARQPRDPLLKAQAHERPGGSGLGMRDVERHEPATGREHAQHLGQPTLQVDQVAQQKAARDRSEAGVGEG